MNNFGSKQHRLEQLVRQALEDGDFVDANPEWGREALEILDGRFVYPCKCEFLEGESRWRTGKFYRNEENCPIHNCYKSEPEKCGKFDNTSGFDACPHGNKKSNCYACIEIFNIFYPGPRPIK